MHNAKSRLGIDGRRNGAHGRRDGRHVFLRDADPLADLHQPEIGFGNLRIQFQAALAHHAEGLAARGHDIADPQVRAAITELLPDFLEIGPCWKHRVP